MIGDRFRHAVGLAAPGLPDWARGRNDLAWLCARCRRKPDEAVKHAERAVALDPERVSYLDTLAEAHFQNGAKAKIGFCKPQVDFRCPREVLYRRGQIVLILCEFAQYIFRRGIIRIDRQFVLKVLLRLRHCLGGRLRAGKQYPSKTRVNARQHWIDVQNLAVLGGSFLPLALRVQGFCV